MNGPNGTSERPRDEAAATVTLMGTGTSTGVPILGCGCRVCASDDERDRRTRTSCLIRVGDLRIVVDTGPDFHRQALREGLDRVDAVLYTHHHFDHVAGIDDLRPFLFDCDRPVPCYGSTDTCAHLEDRHPYIFGERPYPSAPRLALRPVSERFAVADRYGGDRTVEVRPIPLLHGELPVLGYRIGTFAYLTDVSHVPEDSFRHLNGIDVLVLDALRERPHPSHLTFEEAVRIVERVEPDQTYFVHLTHSIPHAELETRLPARVHPGHDGLELRIPAPREIPAPPVSPG